MISMYSLIWATPGLYPGYLRGEFINYNQIIPQDYRTRIRFDARTLL